MIQNKASYPLTPKQELLILSLLQFDTKEAAAREAGVSHATMYRWLADPVFMAAYRAARRAVVDDGLAILEKNFVRAAQVLADELDKKTWSTLKRSPMLISAASRMIDRGFKAQSAIAVQEELANLRTILDALKAGQAPGGSPPAPPPAEPPDDEPPKSEPPRSPWPAFSAAMKACNESPAEKPPETPMIMVNKHEEAEAAVLRVAWMAELGNAPHDIEASLRYNRPTSVTEEQHLLNVVREMLEWERIHEVAMRTFTQ